jgi:protein O-mannosyl-transferase
MPNDNPAFSSINIGPARRWAILRKLPAKQLAQGVRCGRLALAPQAAERACPAPSDAVYAAGSGDNDCGRRIRADSSIISCMGRQRRTTVKGLQSIPPPAWLARIVAGRWTALAGALIVLAGVAVYVNGLNGDFLYDDQDSVIRNKSIQSLWPIWPAFSPPPNGETVSGRPLLNLSLALNYAVGGSTNVFGYHATNVAIHILAALLLFGIVRRTLTRGGGQGAGRAECRQRDKESGRQADAEFKRTPSPCHLVTLSPCHPPWPLILAFAIALLWTVHPLQTESVAYIVQRAESLAGLFYLLTLYCVIRGACGDAPRPPSPGILRVPRPRFWYAAATLACLAGMATKETLVTAPIIVLLYDWLFLSGSLREAMRRRWALYAALAATWLLLGYLVLHTNLLAHGAELHQPHPWSYFISQPGVVLHYLRLCVWPHPLCLDYRWPLARSAWQIVPPSIVIGALLSITVGGLVRRRPWAFLGAWFFLILAPTSTFVPLADLAVEHRLYLPLAAIITLAVFAGYGGCCALSRWMSPKKALLVGGLAFTVIYLVMAVLACRRTADYRNPLAMWQDAVAKAPNNARAHSNLAVLLRWHGDLDSALWHLNRALELEPSYAPARNNLAATLLRQGKLDEAIRELRIAVGDNPHYGDARYSLAAALNEKGRTEEATKELLAVLEEYPDHIQSHVVLAGILTRQGAFDEAIVHYREAVRLKPDSSDAHYGLALALGRKGVNEEAVWHFEKAFELNPGNADVRKNLAAAQNNLATILAMNGQADDAIGHYRRALAVRPDQPDARRNLQILLSRKRNGSGT